MAKGSNTSFLVKEVLALIIAVFILGFGTGFFSARLKYKADLLETTLMAGQKANAVSMLQELRTIHSLEGGALMTNTHMYRVKDGDLKLMEDKIFLKDGTKVNVDGSVIRTNGDNFKLIDGQGIDGQGKLVLINQ